MVHIAGPPGQTKSHQVLPHRVADLWDAYTPPDDLETPFEQEVWKLCQRAENTSTLAKEQWWASRPLLTSMLARFCHVTMLETGETEHLAVRLFAIFPVGPTKAALSHTANKDSGGSLLTLHGHVAMTSCRTNTGSAKHIVTQHIPTPHPYRWGSCDGRRQTRRSCTP